jgi:hypothetical protein
MSKSSLHWPQKREYWSRAHACRRRPVRDAESILLHLQRRVDRLRMLDEGLVHVPPGASRAVFLAWLQTVEVGGVR